ncbi:MAG: T9SS type B sorting domain-containing protein [Saprospiraceae bacterium]
MFAAIKRGREISPIGGHSVGYSSLSYSKRFVFLLSLMLFGFGFQAKATHIVGGEITYRCLGNNKYEITLAVYRDCFNGIPDFDSPASVGIFDDRGNLMTHIGIGGQILFEPISIDTLPDLISSVCGGTLSSVCVNRAIIRDTVTLPYKKGGYNLIYQRCCRNYTVTNIYDPLNTGTTFSTKITELALTECNSSARFDFWPPVAICVNQPINFSFAAFDEDGDSLVYSLCTPYAGADSTKPMPQPPPPPPYDTVVWIAPVYSLTDVLGNPSAPLTINPSTGFLTGTPNIVGQFVVGVCVNEFRNGQLISQTRREFEYNIKECSGLPEAIIAGPSGSCDGDLTVHFENGTATVSPPWNFTWFFDWENNQSATSNLENPTYTYPAFGTYIVKLVASSSATCSDTATVSFFVGIDSTSALFEAQTFNCGDQLILELTNNAYAQSGIASLAWTVSLPGGVILTSNESNPSFLIPANVQATVMLVVTSNNGCQSVETLPIPAGTGNDLGADFTYYPLICNDEFVVIFEDLSDSTGFANPVSWQWIIKHGNITDTFNIQDPTLVLAGPIQVDALLSVTYDNGCIDTSQQIFFATPDPLLNANFTYQALECTGQIKVILTDVTSNIPSPPVSWLWTIEYCDSTSTFTTQNPFLLLDDTCLITANLQVTYANGCTNDTTKTFMGIPDPALGVQFEVSASACADSIALIFQDETGNGASQPIKWDWTIVQDPGGTTTHTGQTVNLVLYGTSQVTATLTVTFADGCINSSTQVFNITPLSSDTIDAVLNICKGDTVELNPVFLPGIKYLWNPNYNIITNTIPNPIAFPEVTTTYTVVLLDTFLGCTTVKHVLVNVSSADVNITANAVQCSNPIILTATGTGTIIWSTSPTLDPVIGTGNSITYNFQGEQWIYAGTLGTGCDGLDSIHISLVPVDFDLGQDTIISCDGINITLNPGGPTNYTYNWSPANLLNSTTAVSPIANVTQSTWIYVTVSVPNNPNCQKVDSVFIQLPDPIVLSVADTVISCANMDTTLSANSPSAVSYIWLNANGDTISLTSSVVVQSGTPTSFIVEVTDANNCKQRDTITFLVPTVSVVVSSGNLDICAGDTPTLTATYTGAGGSTQVSIAWMPDGSIVSGHGTNTIVVNPTETTIYTATVVDDIGCVTTGTGTVNVFSFNPSVVATADPAEIFVGHSTNLHVTIVPGATYQWQPDSSIASGSTGSDPVTEILFETTTFTVTVTAANGCTAVSSVTVTVRNNACEEPFIFLPSAFTPDNDGNNDMLFVKGNIIETMELTIVDRWGKTVFRTEDQAQGWDGKLNGKELGSDVYGYYLRVKCFGREPVFFKGNVSIIR